MQSTGCWRLRRLSGFDRIWSVQFPSVTSRIRAGVSGGIEAAATCIAFARFDAFWFLWFALNWLIELPCIDFSNWVDCENDRTM